MLPADGTWEQAEGALGARPAAEEEGAPEGEDRRAGNHAGPPPPLQLDLGAQLLA